MRLLLFEQEVRTGPMTCALQWKIFGTHIHLLKLTLGIRCSSPSHRFQMKQNAMVDVVMTEKKGYGLRAMEDLDSYVAVLLLNVLDTWYAY